MAPAKNKLRSPASLSRSSDHAGCSLSPAPLFFLLDQQRARRVLEPAVGHHYGARRIGIFALIEPGDLEAPFLVLRKRVRDMNRRADPGQREEAGCGFTVEADAAVRMRRGMDKAFMESIGRLELAPVCHRITAVRFAGAAAVFFFVVDGEVAGRRRRIGFTDVALHGHEQTVAFRHVKILGAERQTHFHLGRIVWLVSNDFIIARRRRNHWCSAARQEQRSRGRQAKEEAGKVSHSCRMEKRITPVLSIARGYGITPEGSMTVDVIGAIPRAPSSSRRSKSWEIFA